MTSMFVPWPRRHEVHEARIEDHEENVEDVEGEEEGGLVVDQVSVPRAADERHDGHGVKEGVASQWSPVQV